MSPPRAPLYGSLVNALASALMAAAVALAVLTVAAVIGPFHLLGAGEGGAAALTLWVPPSAFQAPPEERARRLRAWRAAAGRPLPIAHALDEPDLRVVAVPDARALSDAEADALVAFLQAGGGAILSGAVGVRGPEGGWRGWDTMRRLLQVARVEPRSRDVSFAMQADVRGPVSAGLEAGQRIELHAEPGVPAVDDPQAELRWASAGDHATAASRRLRVGRGRLVWLAAGPEATDEEVADQLFVGGDMTRLLASATAWAGREPFVEVLTWPDRAPFGAHVDPDPEAGELHPPDLADADGAAGRRAAIDAAIERAARSARLFRLAVPAARVAEPERTALLDYATERLRRRGAWFGHSGDIAGWKRLRGQLVATVSRVGPNRHTIDVANPNPERVRGAALRVHLNVPAADVGVERTILQQDDPVVRLDPSRQRLDIELPELPGRARLAYTLDLEVAGDAGRASDS